MLRLPALEFIRRLLGVAAFLSGLQAQAATFDPGCYQGPDGAITVSCSGNFVDPYFAARALLSARQAGLDITAPAQSWIAWLLPRQRADGTFPRFCRKEGEWEPCARADADDALMALWVELLYVMAPCTGMPPEWQRSAKLANTKLKALFDRKTGLYHIASDLPVSLLMDNVEIYATLREISRRQVCMHNKPAAQRSQRAAAKLRVAIMRTFRQPGQAEFDISTQQHTSKEFYPAAVAQIYPILFRMGSDPKRRQKFDVWMQAHGGQWLAQQHDHFPWGLVALTSADVGDTASAGCWRMNVEAFRHGPRWNVLEEAAFQSLSQVPLPIGVCPQVPSPSEQRVVAPVEAQAQRGE